MKKAFIFCLCSVLSLSLSAQQNNNLIKKTIKKFLSSKNDSSRGASFIVLPAVGYSQESGLEYGFASTYNFYADKSDLSSRTSNLTLMATMTTKQQKNIKLTSDIWTKNNDYHIISELRFRDWPFNFYGIGNKTLLINEDHIDQELFRVKLDIEKKITSKLYLGVNANFEHFSFSDYEPGGVFESNEVLGKTGGKYLALGVSALFDTRNNTTYSTSGLYSRIKYAYAPNFWGGDNFTGSQIELDVRYFYPLTPKLTTAIQTLYRASIGKDMPFYAFRDLGGDMTMRGYYLGRYKDKSYTATQAELRYRIIPRLGAVVFGGTGSTFSPQHNLRLVPSFGGGIRYFFSLEHNSTIRLDYAYGEKRSGEKRQSGFYLSISEAF
ncbi:polymerase [Sphingobacterium alkalisoli]|uniref:Polymerase n=1 Tax=Sphingobacterium alkalisoli TaxID=1874115 RepID=A0A4U0HA44_9SPHI|nr:BamA/TamA family outer membrane protein [Sphingobacterium alkalisoli]TJY68678.1 polymerase [Sphingobacterium alkalisoli]GGH04874.1 membrane protein [Sphingobacterium alkalisoli]